MQQKQIFLEKENQCAQMHMWRCDHIETASYSTYHIVSNTCGDLAIERIRSSDWILIECDSRDKL